MLPERGPAERFLERKAGRARRACPTGNASLTQKARRTTACCWAVETPTTGVKAMKGLTRPCADLAEPKGAEARAIARQDRACAKTDFSNSEFGMRKSELKKPKATAVALQFRIPNSAFRASSGVVAAGSDAWL